MAGFEGGRTAPGYWVPGALRERVLEGATFETTWGLRAQLVAPETPGATGAIWPMLQPAGWRALWEGLHAAPSASVAALETALQRVARRLSDPGDDLCRAARVLLPPHTGFPEAMLSFAFGFFQDLELAPLARMTAWSPPAAVRRGFLSLPELPGSVRFYPAGALDRAQARLGTQFARSVPPPRTLVGYAAGNIPGAALLVALLGLILDPRPAVVVRNSRREPFFTPLLLAALEEIDPALVANVAVLLWDYDDAALQAAILREADLLFMVAGDDTIARIEAEAREAYRQQAGAFPRLHRHGHKVSFIAVASELLTGERLPLLAPLAALDTVVWDQNGCLSPRLHFVEEGGALAPEDYADAVTEALQTLSRRLPGGLVDLRRLHSRFDKYHALAAGGRATVHSAYDDPFLVVVDRRRYDRLTLGEAIGDARDRTVIVRPVPALGAIPREVLRRLPPRNLQTLSVALDSRAPAFLPFAEAVGRCGITALRTVGRAAFPGLAHSWDGLLPCDLVTTRPAGHYTTIEFDDALTQIEETASRLRAWLDRG
jgi:hypothetical protein